MKALVKKILDFLSGCNLLRFRLTNVKLAGNKRWGIYSEISAADLLSFVNDFHAFCNRVQSVVPATAENKKKSLLANSNFTILQRLCEQYYVYEGTEKFQQKILLEVQEIIAELRDDAQAQKLLEDWLDATQDGVMAQLKKEHPELSDADFRLYAYLSAGFTPTMIAVLLRKEKSVVYNRVSRLKAKIAQVGENK